jgi:hypothetical protein
MACSISYMSAMAKHDHILVVDGDAETGSGFAAHPVASGIPTELSAGVDVPALFDDTDPASKRVTKPTPGLTQVKGRLPQARMLGAVGSLGS